VGENAFKKLLICKIFAIILPSSGYYPAELKFGEFLFDKTRESGLHVNEVPPAFSEIDIRKN
jgi:hypothetical protein